MWGKGREEVPHLSTTLPRVQSQGMNRAAVLQLVVSKVPCQPSPKLASRAKLSEAQKQIGANKSNASYNASAKLANRSKHFQQSFTSSESKPPQFRWVPWLLRMQSKDAASTTSQHTLLCLASTPDNGGSSSPPVSGCMSFAGVSFDFAEV